MGNLMEISCVAGWCGFFGKQPPDIASGVIPKTDLEKTFEKLCGLFVYRPFVSRLRLVICVAGAGFLLRGLAVRTLQGM